MDNARCRWRRLFCFTKGSLAVHLSADWRQRCLFEPLGCKEMNSLAVLSQSFSRAWLFMWDSLHGPQLNPVLPVIAILQRVTLGIKLGMEFCCIEKNIPDTHWLELKGWIHIFLIKSSYPCVQVGTIWDGVSLSPVSYLKWYSLLFFASEQQQERSPWKYIYPQAGKGNGVKESKEANV